MKLIIFFSYFYNLDTSALKIIVWEFFVREEVWEHQFVQRSTLSVILRENMLKFVRTNLFWTFHGKSEVWRYHQERELSSSLMSNMRVSPLNISTQIRVVLNKDLSTISWKCLWHSIIITLREARRNLTWRKMNEWRQKIWTKYFFSFDFYRS